MSTCLTVCANIAAGGWRRPPQRCFGNISDTLAFFFIAFWRSPDAFMAEHWMEIALVDYCFKVLISIIFFLPMYGVLLNMLLKKLADKSEISPLPAS
ncbi:membrane protein [Salmonella enterica subsp. salamae]|uniref:Queuosine precursor transporter n=1 Tax=Salmonella enterica subsp. salamae TaxID=59202 RepID=A0A6D2G386_SALER|nr:membrane protein [Salmonella enterica subsp. salamae]